MRASPEAVETCLRQSEDDAACFQIDVTIDGGDLEAANEFLVELTGIEPVTPCLQSRCSPS